jgi:hypothetical protein
MQLEIEAFPKKEGAACTVILYDNIAGPFTKDNGADQEPSIYFTYDRYEVETYYREGLKESVQESFGAWLQKAKEAEAAGEPLTEIEILQQKVQTLTAANKELSSTVDNLVIASLGGDL